MRVKARNIDLTQLRNPKTGELTPNGEAIIRAALDAVYIKNDTQTDASINMFDALDRNVNHVTREVDIPLDTASNNVKNTVSDTVYTDVDTLDVTLVTECALLRQRIDALERLISDKDTQIADLKSEREAWRQDAEHWHRMADQSQQLHLAQIKALPAPREGWWARFTKRKPAEE